MSAMSELGQEDGRLFFVAGLGSTALFAVACFLALMPVIHRRSRSYRVGAFARSGFARGKPWLPSHQPQNCWSSTSSPSGLRSTYLDAADRRTERP